MKKLFTKKTVFLLFLILFMPQFIFSQVGINTETPNSLTALDISLVIEGTEVVPKGMMVPRMTEAQRNQIDVTNQGYANSLLIYNTDEDCFNYFSKTEKSWVNLCGESDEGNAVFTVDCSQTSVKGSYMVETPLGTSNYLVLTVVVTKAGSYNISAFPVPDNGYYFSAIGEFVKPGSYTLRVPGVGIPTTGNEYGDQLLVQNYNELLCDNLTVKINSPKYLLDCSSIVISGTYIATVPLTAQNTIQIKLTADAGLAGYQFETSTTIVNGYSFSGSGILVAGEQIITLTGSGTPIKNGMDTFVLKNTQVDEDKPVASCAAKIDVSPRPVRILTVTSSTVGYNLGNSSNYANKALMNPNYFSLDASAKYSTSGFVFNSVTSNNRLEAAMTSFKPDIIFTQYAFVVSSSEITALSDFVSKGGVFIYCTDYSNSSSSNILPLTQSIFNNTTITINGADTDNVVTLEDSGTKITSGPFEDLVGKGMARDANGNFGFTTASLPADQVTVIAYSNNKASVRMFAHKTKGFVFVGDGGPFASSNNNSPYSSPAKFAISTSDGESTAVVNSYSDPVSYNSDLLLNTIAWAIDYIKNSGVYP